MWSGGLPQDAIACAALNGHVASHCLPCSLVTGNIALPAASRTEHARDSPPSTHLSLRPSPGAVVYAVIDTVIGFTGAALRGVGH